MWRFCRVCKWRLDSKYVLAWNVIFKSFTLKSSSESANWYWVCFYISESHLTFSKLSSFVPSSHPPYSCKQPTGELSNFWVAGTAYCPATCSGGCKPHHKSRHHTYCPTTGQNIFDILASYLKSPGLFLRLIQVFAHWTGLIWNSTLKETCRHPG